jgi:hypothetical protein
VLVLGRKRTTRRPSTEPEALTGPGEGRDPSCGPP